MNKLFIKTVKYREELQSIQTIRTKVFQQEQKVAAELEFDGLDETATHLLAYLEGQPVGTARIRKIDRQTAKIERLAVLPTARRKGIGKQLMEKALEIIAMQKYQLVIVHAQEYVKPLYQQLGFKQIGNKFEEANIPHIKMMKKISQEY